MEKKISVVICTHNRPELLKRAVRSVLNQTYKNVELIVSDDSTNEHTKNIVSRIKIENPNFDIKYRKNKTNSGACYTRNRGIELATGFFITGLDDDDTFDKNRLKYFIDSYNSKYSFYCSNITVIDRNKKYLLFNGFGSICLNKILWYNYVGNQIFIEKSRFDSVGGFDENLNASQDIDLWIRLVERYGDCFRLPKSTYNLHIDHEEPRITTSSKKIDGLNQFYFKHKGKMSSSQRDFYLLRKDFWENNKKISLRLLKYCNFRVLLFIIKHNLRIW